MKKKLKAKVSPKEVEEVVIVNEEKDVALEELEHLTDTEQKALVKCAGPIPVNPMFSNGNITSKSVEPNESTISTNAMEAVVALVEHEFNLANKGYQVTSYAQKKSTNIISLSNDSFDITIALNDFEEIGL